MHMQQLLIIKQLEMVPYDEKMWTGIKKRNPEN